PPSSTLFPYTTLFRSLVEPERGDRILAVAVVAGELRAVLEAPRIGQKIGAVIVGRAVRLERSPIAVRDGDQLVIRIALRRRDRRSEEHTSELQSRENL